MINVFDIYILSVEIIIWLVLKIPRKRSFPFYYLALCCLFAFIWHLSLTLLVA